MLTKQICAPIKIFRLIHALSKQASFRYSLLKEKKNVPEIK